MKVCYYLVGLVSVCFAMPSEGARILALLPLAARSHHIFFQAVLNTLVSNGHQVVVYSPYPQKNPLPNYKDVFINSSFSELSLEDTLKVLQTSRIAAGKGLLRATEKVTEDTFRHESIQKLIRSNEKYDLVITEASMGLTAFVYFGHKFNAPTISLHSLVNYAAINKFMGNSLSISYVPDNVLPFSDHMTLFERIINSYSIVRTLFYIYNENIPRHQAILDKYVPMNDAPPLMDMVHNMSLVFINAHPSIYYAQPYSPNIIPLGGIHIAPTKTSLPKDIQNFMDEAQHGVVYFSLGTFIPEHKLKAEIFHHFINVFKKLNQRVLWKTRNKNLTSLVPKNVKVGSWMPQQDVLAHPNCVLFMTHGGLLSLLEAVDAGVPVVGIPFVSDQPNNVHFYEERGIGVHLDFLEISEDSIYNAVTTVLNNPKYKENALKMSRIFRDLPMTQTESAVYWTQYVIKHGGRQLQPASVYLNWYQLALLDVIAALSLVVIFAILLVYKCCKIISKLLLNFITTYGKLNSKKLN